MMRILVGITCGIMTMIDFRILDNEEYEKCNVVIKTTRKIEFLFIGLRWTDCDFLK